jgi:hypothetical protein
VLAALLLFLLKNQNTRNPNEESSAGTKLNLPRKTKIFKSRFQLKLNQSRTKAATYPLFLSFSLSLSLSLFSLFSFIIFFTFLSISLIFSLPLPFVSVSCLLTSLYTSSVRQPSLSPFDL